MCGCYHSVSVVECGAPGRDNITGTRLDRTYRVDCMSITRAFAFGYNRTHCASACSATRSSAYSTRSAPLNFCPARWRIILLPPAACSRTGSR